MRLNLVFPISAGDGYGTAGWKLLYIWVQSIGACHVPGEQELRFHHLVERRVAYLYANPFGIIAEEEAVVPAAIEQRDAADPIHRSQEALALMAHKAEEAVGGLQALRPEEIMVMPVQPFGQICLLEEGLLPEDVAGAGPMAFGKPRPAVAIVQLHCDHGVSRIVSIKNRADQGAHIMAHGSRNYTDYFYHKSLSHELFVQKRR
jgi:hypothetical protein